ncbi:hypothetical protein ES706_04916 [subsurface metagenome]
MPTMLASQSAKLAVRPTKDWVSSSIVPIAKIAKKRNAANSIVGELLSERMKRKVITPYARACASLSRPLICNRIGITSSGIWVSKTTITVKITATISRLILK